MSEEYGNLILNIKTKLKNNGMVCIKNFFNKKESYLIQKWAHQLEELPEVKNEYMKYYENINSQKVLSRIEYFSKYNNDINNFLKFKITPFLEQILEKDMFLFKDKINWKMPGGGGFEPHQDHPAWDDFKLDIFYSIAISADNSTIDKGCLQFADKESIILENTFSGIKPEISKYLNFKKYETTPRDLIIFDSFIPHKSESNITDETRRIFYFTYAEKDFYEEYNQKKRTECPPNIERDSNKTYNNKYNLANPISLNKL